jgi:hypothetical protein
LALLTSDPRPARRNPAAGIVLVRPASDVRAGRCRSLRLLGGGFAARTSIDPAKSGAWAMSATRTRNCWRP